MPTVPPFVDKRMMECSPIIIVIIAMSTFGMDLQRYNRLGLAVTIGGNHRVGARVVEFSRWDL